MAVTEILAKTMLAHVKQPDPFFGLRYNMNLYRGCQHQCIYCDSRSLCYGIDDFSQIQIKVNALDLLAKELPRKREKGVIGTGSMNDPYMPLEKQVELTRGALALIARHGFGVHIITKSDLVLRDADHLVNIARVHALVTFSIATTDDALARRLEPGAPPPSARFAAMRSLSEQGILTGVAMMPILPWLEDDAKNIKSILASAAASGAKYILPWFGLSMRDRQRDYFYQQLDRLFPGLRQRYESRYGSRYACDVPNAAVLRKRFAVWTGERGIAHHVPQYPGDAKAQQLALFD